MTKVSTRSLDGSIAEPTFAWRLVREKYADLSGLGAKEKGGRWNSLGQAAVYFSTDAALPVVEVLVHLDLQPDLIPDDYVLMKVDLSPLAALPPGPWLEDGPIEILEESDSRTFGDQWLMEARTPVLRVPSVIVPESFNLVFNPDHSLAGALSEVTYRPFEFDARLF